MFFVSSGGQSEVWGQRSTEALCLVTLEVMNSSLVSMSGVRRQARNFLEVRAVSSWRTPETHDTMGLSCCPPDPSHTQQDPEGFTRAHSGVKDGGQCWEGSFWTPQLVLTGHVYNKFQSRHTGEVQTGGFTCKLRTEDLWVVQQVFPHQLHLWDPSNILQQANQISPDDQTLHKLERESGSADHSQLIHHPHPPPPILTFSLSMLMQKSTSF